MAKNNPLSTLLYIAFGIFLAFAVNQGLAFALATDLPIVAVESNSMLPAFQKGDGLVLYGASAESLEVGDIIVFTPPGKEIAVVHRIVKINEDGTFQTKGDANMGQLPYERRIPESAIHGRVIMIIPYMGWVKIGLTEVVLPNIMWVVISAALLMGVYIGLSSWRRSSWTFVKSVTQ